MARAVASTVRERLGQSADDLLADGWLGYADAAARGLGHAGCMARARGAMLDGVRAWGGLPRDHGDGCPTVVLCGVSTVLADAPAPRRRTRLPKAVRRALAQLPVRQRRALQLWTMQGAGHPEIAATLACAEGTSARLRHEALQSLRARFDVRSPARSDRRSRHSPFGGSASTAPSLTGERRRAPRGVG